MDQAGHVVPASEIQSHNVVAKIPSKFLHLKCQRMRFDQRHALDGIRGQTFESRNHLEQIAPPKCLVRGFGFRNVNAQRMLQRAEVHLISHHCDIEQRSRKQFSGQNSRLVQVQSAGPREDNGGTRIDADGFVALTVEVREPARERLKNVFDAARVVFPGVGSGVFQIEHDAGRAGIQHLHNKIGVVCRSRHLVPLIRAPRRKLNAPGIRGGHRRRQVIGELPGVRFG